MVKTLKIAVFVFAPLSIFAIAGVVYLALQPDRDVQEFLSTKSQIEAFVETARQQQKKDESPNSPLVEQAKQFTLRIDPPPPPAPKGETPEFASSQQQIVKAPPPSARFTLEGTVVSSNPKFSMAFLNTTSKGHRWYRQSEKIGYITIEEIYQDKIVVNDGEKTYEMEVPNRQKISLLRGDPNNPYTSYRVNPYKSKTNDQPVRYEPATALENFPANNRPQRPVNTTTASNYPQSPQLSEDKLKENLDFLQKLANDPESMGLTKEEAAQLGDMSDLMNELEKDMKQAQRRRPRGR